MILCFACTRRIYSMMGVYISYLAMGAVVFLAVEKYNTSENPKNKASELIQSMVKTLRKENFTRNEIAYIFNRKREEFERKNHSVVVTWKKVFDERFIFSMVLIMTIGYGNVRPTTPWSQSLCILYGFFGVPLNLTYIRILDLQFRYALRKVIKKTGQLIDSLIFVTLSIITYFIFFIMLFFYVPATIFNSIEGWTYYESLYYCFVTLATIGFGDYESHVNFKYYKCDCYSMNVVLMFTWLLLGRSFFFMCSNLLSYIIGTLILDQLDCKCQKRIYAKAQLQDIYDSTAELNWQLAKLRPVNFTKWSVIEKFTKTCNDNPQKITKEKLLEILQVLDKLEEALHEELECLEILDKPTTVEVCKPYHENIVADSTSDAKSVK